MTISLLFVVRTNDAASVNYSFSANSGVAQSAGMLVDALTEKKITAVAATVSALDDILYVVDLHKPTHVIIETLWLTSDEMQSLITAFPEVTFIARDHSESCFRVLEVDSSQRIIDYLKMGVEVMSNSVRSMTDIIAVATAIGADTNLASYGPNVYPVPDESDMVPHTRSDSEVNIGCFGAVRTMKNHITQAIAAIQFAQWENLSLKFHINSYDIPGYVDPVLNNLRFLFANTNNAELVEHGWMTREDFLKVIAGMDICSQVSFTETFNIVTADAMSQAVPIIASDSIAWIGASARRRCESMIDIACGFQEIWKETSTEQTTRLKRQRADMSVYVNDALTVWTNKFGS